MSRFSLASIILRISLIFVIFLSVTQKLYAKDKLNIVATTSMVADAIKQIGGDRVLVTTLMGPGIDPHAYRQTRTDIVRMARADIIFRHGLYLEAQMEDFFNEISKKKKLVTVTDKISKKLLLKHDEYKNQFDPHIWMNPSLWLQVANRIQQSLSQADPDGKKMYQVNAEVYSKEIKKLASYSDKTIGTVPNKDRVLLTAHDAFNYFGQAYNFKVLGIQGISTESEAGLKRIEELVDLIVTRKINAVFVETSVADRNIKAIIEGAAARGHKVIVGGELFSDAMGHDNTYEGTYIGMIDHNVTTITRALGGKASPKGMQGLLSVGS